MLPSSLTIFLDRSDRRTLSVQIADRIRASIAEGNLPADSRLPSSRALSVDIGVARGVVESAFEQLTAEGWLYARRGSGTYVRLLPVTEDSAHRASRPPPPSRVTLLDARRTRLATGTPWVSPQTSAAWKRAWRDVASAPPPQSYPDPQGESWLRTAVSELLARTRGLHADADSIVITTGSMHGFSLALPALAGVAPVLAHENPGYRVATTAARRSGWSLFDVDVDAEGMVTDQLASAPDDTRAVYVTPSHQYPTGGLLPVGRRRDLAEFARTRDIMIIEDDYDSEFRYDVAPLPTVAEIAPDRTIYLGTVAKTLGGGIRLGWLVAPTHIVDDIVSVRSDIGDYPSVPVQRAMASLLRDGEWDRTVRAARRRYRARDRRVSDALSPYGELRGVGAGMHTTLLLDRETAAEVARRAAAGGVDVDTLEKSTRGPTSTSGIVVGYGSVSDEELEHGLAVLAEALNSVS